MEINSQKSLLEIAITIVEEANAPVAINDIITKALEIKGIDDPKGEKRTQLYVDITTSSMFVYMGEGKWDLKSHQSLAEFDKDGADFNDDTVVEDDEVSAADFDTEDEEEKKDEDDEDSFEADAEEYDEKNPYADDDDMEADDTDESEFDDIRDTPDQDDFDEDKYGSIMDSYEDLYDK